MSCKPCMERAKKQNRIVVKEKQSLPKRSVKSDSSSASSKMNNLRDKLRFNGRG